MATSTDIFGYEKARDETYRLVQEAENYSHTETKKVYALLAQATATLALAAAQRA